MACPFVSNSKHIKARPSRSHSIKLMQQWMRLTHQKKARYIKAFIRKQDLDNKTFKNILIN